MLKVKTGKQEYDIAFDDRHLNRGSVNEAPFEWDFLRLKEDRFHVIKDKRSYNVDVLKADYKEKLFVIRINGHTYTLNVQDQFDILLDKMGMNLLTSTRISNVKAPMPGLVLDVMVQKGAQVKKGDPLLILEAMKMENILKSPADGVIQKVLVNKSMPVEKNEILINFE